MSDEFVECHGYNLFKNDFEALKKILELIPGKDINSLLSLPETNEYNSWKEFAQKFNLPFDANNPRDLNSNIRKGLAILTQSIMEYYQNTYNEGITEVLNSSDFNALANELVKLNADEAKKKLLESHLLINKTAEKLGNHKNLSNLKIVEQDFIKFMHSRKISRLSKDEVNSIVENNSEYYAKARDLLDNHNSFLGLYINGEAIKCFIDEFKIKTSPRIYFDANNGRVTTLYLKACGLESIPKEISLLSGLEHLVLFGNKINEIDNISNLPNLKYLDIHANRITVLRGLPKQLDDKLKLNEKQRKEFLNFDREVKILSDDYFKLKEEQLIAFRKILNLLRNSGDKELYDFAGRNLDIKVLDNSLVELRINYPIKELPDELIAFPFLNVLDLSFCMINNIKPLKKIDCLKSLNLDYTLVTNVSLLSNLPSLEELHLCNIISRDKFNETHKNRILKYEEVCKKNEDDLWFFRLGEYTPYQELSRLDPRITDNKDDYLTQIKGLGKLTDLKRIYVNDKLMQANKKELEGLKEKGVEIIINESPVFNIKK